MSERSELFSEAKAVSGIFSRLLLPEDFLPTPNQAKALTKIILLSRSPSLLGRQTTHLPKFNSNSFQILKNAIFQIPDYTNAFHFKFFKIYFQYFKLSRLSRAVKAGVPDYEMCPTNYFHSALIHNIKISQLGFFANVEKSTSFISFTNIILFAENSQTYPF